MIKSTLQSWIGAWKELKQWVFPASTEVPSGAQRGAFWIDDVPKWYDGTTERNFGIDKLYAGVVTQPTITVNSNIITIGDNGVMRVYDNANYAGLVQEFTPAGASITIPASSDVFLCYSIADGYHLRNALDYTINYSDIITVKRYIYEFGILHESDQDNLALGQSEKQILRIATTEFYKRVGTSGIDLSISTLTANITGGKIYNGPVLQNLDAFVSSTDIFSRHTIAGSAWSRTAMTAINTSIYNPSTGEAALPTNKWAWAFIYRTVGDTNEAIVRYGDQYFNDKTKAIEGIKLPSSVSLTIRAHTVLVGYICYKSGDTSIPVENVYSAWDSLAVSGGGGVSEHNALSAIDGGEPAIPYYGHNTQLMQSRQVNAGAANGYAVYDANGNLGEYVQLRAVLGTGQTSKLTASALNSSSVQGWTKLYSWSPAAYNKRHLMLHATSGDRGTLTGVISVSFMQEANATTISTANITSEHIAGTVSNFSLIYNTDTSMIELWYNDIFSSNQQTVFSPIKISGTTPTAYYGVSQASLPAYSTKFDSVNLHVDYLEGLTGNVQELLNGKSPLNTTLADNAASSTLPTTASGSLVSKIQQVRDYLKYLLAQISGKQDTLIFDSTPTYGSSNPVTSNGVYDALSAKVPITKNYWNATYIGDTYRYVKIASITTSDSDYTSHCLFVGKSFFGGQHHIQGHLYIAQNGYGGSSLPLVSFVGQSNRVDIIYTFDDTANLLEVYLYLYGGEGGGLSNGITTNIITSTDPSRITLLTSGNMLASVPDGITAKYFAVNPLDGNTATNGNLIVGGGSTITGPAHIGWLASDSTKARFGHSSFNTDTGFGYLQTQDGSVYFDTPTGQKIFFRVNGQNKNYMDESGFFHFMKPSTSDDTNTVPTTAWVKSVAAPINATLTNESGQDVLPTGTYAITALLQWFRNNLSQLFSAVAGKAPTNHASSSTTYGRSTANAFGHSSASGITPTMNGTGNAGTDNGYYAREGHVHPTDTSRLAVGSGLNAGASVVTRAYNINNTYAANTIYLEY